MLNNYTSKTRAQLTTAGYNEKQINALTDIEVILLGETIRRPQAPVKVSTRYAAEILCLTSKGLINHEFNANLQCFECILPETETKPATTETTNKPARSESKLNYTLAQIEDTTGILPSVIASRIVWDKLDNESETLTGEQIEAIENEFTAYAENKFVNVFNTNTRFRKVCARVESIDDLSEIYQYLESWFEGWHKRQTKRASDGTKQTSTEQPTIKPGDIVATKQPGTKAKLYKVTRLHETNKAFVYIEPVTKDGKRDKRASNHSFSALVSNLQPMPLYYSQALNKLVTIPN